jgi:hypothetical protein
LLSYNVDILTWGAAQVDQAPASRRNNPLRPGRQNGLLAAMLRRRDNSSKAAGACGVTAGNER